MLLPRPLMLLVIVVVVATVVEGRTLLQNPFMRSAPLRCPIDSENVLVRRNKKTKTIAIFHIIKITFENYFPGCEAFHLGRGGVLQIVREDGGMPLVRGSYKIFL